MATETTLGGDGSLFVGEDKTIRLELLDVDGLPVSMTGWGLLFDVRKNDTSAEPAILSRTPTLTGTYNSVRATNTQRAVVILTDTELNLFRAQTYRYSFKRTDNDSETVLTWGDFAPQKATAP